MVVAQVGANLASKSEVDARSAAAGAVTVAGVLGGPKTKAAAAVATAVSRVVGVRDPDAAAPAPAGEEREKVVLRVVATVAGGCVMPVTVEGVGDFKVVVPAGTAIGEAFDFGVCSPPHIPPPPLPQPNVDIKRDRVFVCMHMKCPKSTQRSFFRTRLPCHLLLLRPLLSVRPHHGREEQRA